MSGSTYLDYLSLEDLQKILTAKGKKPPKLNLEQAQIKFRKAIKDKTITAAKIRKAWSNAMKKQFFDVYQRVFRFTPTKKFDTSTKLKNELKKKSNTISRELKIKNVTSFVSKLSSSPQHYLYAITFKQMDDFQNFLSVPLKSQTILSIFPEIGIAVLWPMDKDRKFKFATKLLSSTFKEVSEIKVNALLLRKYSTQETINKLTISTPQEIAGFTGLDVIEFRGPNVILGLSGLKRRHDANVDVITRVGPFTEIESNTISLVCSKGILFKSYEGIDNLLKTTKSE